MLLRGELEVMFEDVRLMRSGRLRVKKIVRSKGSHEIGAGLVIGA